MRPFVLELTARRDDPAALAQGSDLRSVEDVSPLFGFLLDNRQIAADGAARCRVLLKSHELRMVPIAPRDTTQDRARQQRLAPERHQAMRIEMRRVDGPDSHYRYLSHQAGVRSFTRANQRLIGISTARIAAQHR